jgi:hypothetical protein
MCGSWRLRAGRMPAAGRRISPLSSRRASGGGQRREKVCPASRRARPRSVWMNWLVGEPEVASDGFMGPVTRPSEWGISSQTRTTASWAITGRKYHPWALLYDSRERQHLDLGFKGGKDPLGGGGRVPTMRPRMLRKLSAGLPPSSWRQKYGLSSSGTKSIFIVDFCLESFVGGEI